MKRPNLARQPFLDTRPVWAAAGVLWLLALGLTGYSLRDYLVARKEKQQASGTLASLVQKSQELSQRVATLNRELSQVKWKKLQQEVDSVAHAASQRQLRWEELLADLEELLPWDVRLASIAPSVTANGTIRVALEGLSAGREAWLGFLARLLEDPRFSSPVPRQEQAPGQGFAAGYQFSLSVTYHPEGRL